MNLRNYDQAKEFLGERTSRKLPSVRETYVSEVIPGVITIAYRGTAVVTHYQDGRTVLRSGGYRTVTTKRRMNRHTYVHVYQSKHVWYVDGVPGTTQSIAYHDAMHVGKQIVHYATQRNLLESLR